jgi:hypothetical protein
MTGFGVRGGYEAGVRLVESVPLRDGIVLMRVPGSPPPAAPQNDRPLGGHMVSKRSTAAARQFLVEVAGSLALCNRNGGVLSEIFTRLPAHDSAAPATAIPGERRLLVCSNSQAPNNKPPTANSPDRPRPMTGAGTGF